MASKPGLDNLDPDLAARYRSYLECLNGRAWPDLGLHASDDVVYNDETVRLAGYRSMRNATRTRSPICVHPGLLVVQPPYVAVRLEFISPRGRFLNLGVNGRRGSFTENVFYRYQTRIAQVWSVIDKAAVERQLQDP